MSESSLKEKLATLKEQIDAPESETVALTSQEEVIPTTVIEPDQPEVVISEPIKAQGMIDPGKQKFNVFYSTHPSCKTMTPMGRVINFVGHKFVTNVQEEIDYLQLAIQQGSSSFYTKAGEEIVEADDLDPMKKLKKQHIAEYLAEQKALAAKIAAGKSGDSISEPQKVVPASTKDIAEVSAASDSVA